MKKIILLLLLFTILFCSCGSTSKIIKGSIYKLKESDDLDNPVLQRFSVKKKSINLEDTISIEEKDKFLKITGNLNNSRYSRKDSVIEKTLAAEKFSDKKKMYFFPENVVYDKDNKERLVYTNGKKGIQTLAVAVKFRAPVKNSEFNIPSTVEGGGTFGFSFGYKMSRNVWKDEKNIFNKNLSIWSITPGVLIGTGVATLDPRSEAPKIPIAKKSATLGYGGFVMFGYGNINLGYAIGMDTALSAGNYWAYQNKLWHGLVFAVDVLKF